MDSTRLKEILSGFSNGRVLVIGDLMVDEYLWGNVDRISPEAPVQVVEVKRENRSLGGAGNVIANLVSLGGKVDLAGVVGNDSDGDWIIQQMKGLGVGHELLIRDPNRPTIKKTRVIAVNQQVVRIDRETKQSLSPNAEEYLLDCIKKEIYGWEAIILSDYGKGLLTPHFLKRIISLGKRRGIKVIIDPKGDDFKRYKGAYLITPNKKEAFQGMGLGEYKDIDIGELGKTMIMQLDLKGLIITLGAEGMYVFTQEEEPRVIPTRAREVYDVSGAGDTVAATISLSLLSGADLKMAAEIANLAAGIVVGKIGTATVTQEELLTYMDKGYTNANKIVSNHAELARLLIQHKHRGDRVVFTNGCFDLIHLGHIRLLHESKAFGDILVVGLNTDASVKRLKGPSRPCLGEEERAHIIAALDCVDYVTLFHEDTPVNLIQMLKPDILVKGSDYRKTEVIGWDIVESYGGEVRLVELIRERSTSQIIEKIINQHRS